MTKEKTNQANTLTEKEAVELVKEFLLSELPRGLTVGKNITISKELPEKNKTLKEFNWDIPVLEKPQKTIEAIKLLKEQGYKIYLTKIL
ncbi:MAG TPA: hypothetical protein EYP33_06140 [Pyrodictium sp.]|nr:hypothetical protein [Pyrodictium sp.]